MESDDYKAAATKARVGADWVGPEKSQALVDSAYQALTGYADLAKK